MFRALAVVFVKELRDLLRDRRALFFLFGPPTLGPLLAVCGILFLGWQVAAQAPEGLAVAVQGAEQVPELVARLEANDLLQLVEPPRDPQRALQNGDLTSLLTVPPDTTARLAAELPVTLTITTSRLGWMPTLADATIRDAVTDYGRLLLAERLDGRGLDRDWVQPVRLADGDVAVTGVVTPFADGFDGQPAARSFTGMMLPFLIASWTLGGGLSLMAYMTVGEKERATMESLLVTVASRVGTVLGKMALSILASLATLAVWAAVAVGYLLLTERAADLGAGQSLIADPRILALGATALWLLALMLPLMTMTNGLTAAVCTFARNYREASLFTTLLQLGLPVLSIGAVFVAPAVPHPLVYAVPFLGVLVAVRDLFLRGLSPALLLLSAVASVVYAVLSILVAAYVFSREWALMRGL